ncbi:hypothetical protein GCM10010238_35590 [Streptomyces griseoviridis]|uniref:PAC domain-containing protein n=1 Tax=Streptomyces griseoviridis TaxID=45398 RepID=A0A918LGB4_STRGD|nr:hypothetical protein GCM10010238_35590 [Streptomyces niveoruber]
MDPGAGAVGRAAGTERAASALEAVLSGTDPGDRLRRTLEQALVFAGASFAALYTPGEDPGLLCLAESAGVPRTLYGLRDTYPADGDTPVAGAHRDGRPVWLSPAELAGYAAARRVPAGGFSLAALPLPEDGGSLLAVTERPDGFGTGGRAVLELVAEAVVRPAPATAAEGGELPPDLFALAMDTGRVEAGDDILGLFGLAPREFDGRIETLLRLTVPEDLPALMSVVEADHMSLGERELEFRVQRPGRAPRWLRLRGRMLPGGEGRPARLVGTVADAASVRSDVTDVARVQRLAAALATAGTVREAGQAVVTALRGPLRADRIALAGLENDRLVVTVLDPPDPEAWPEVWRTEWRTEWPDAPVRHMPTLAAALRDGRPRIWPAGADALEPALADVGPGGLAVLPLPAGDRAWGICLIGWDGPHDFGADERALLTASAGLAGQALTRAHAFDAEHELVGMLQRQLLPRRLPDLPGASAVARYLPSTAGLELGGDWYDVVPLPDHHVALVIGDVQGHSAGAATLMGQMRTALRAYAVEGHPPDVVVARANRLLVDMETDLFATCGYVDLDMEEGTAWCVRAGHPPWVLRHPDGRTERVEVEGGPPLGVVAQAEFPMSPPRARPRRAARPDHRRPRRIGRHRPRRGPGPAGPRALRRRPRPPRPGRRRPARRRRPQRRRRPAAGALRRDGAAPAARELDGVACPRGGPARPSLHPARPARLAGAGRRRRHGAAGRLRAGHQRPGAHRRPGPSRPHPPRGTAAGRGRRLLAAHPRPAHQHRLGGHGRAGHPARRGDVRRLGDAAGQRRQAGVERDPGRAGASRGCLTGGVGGTRPRFDEQKEVDPQVTTDTSEKTVDRRPETGWAEARRWRGMVPVRTWVPAVEETGVPRTARTGPEANIVRGED